MYTFTAKSTKANAKRTLVNTHKLPAEVTGQYLAQDGEAWGFYTDEQGAPVEHQVVYAAKRAEDNRPPAGMTTEAAPAVRAAWPAFTPPAGTTTEAAPAPATPVIAAARDEELEAALAQHDAEGNDVPAGPFGMMRRMLAAAKPETAAAPAGAKAAQPNRDEANGIKRPGDGTICARVWAMCAAAMADTGRVPALGDIVDAALLQGINKFTARTQYACWRKFSGLTGIVVRKN